MKRIKEWLLDVFVYAGITKAEYEESKDEISEKNRKVLRISSAIAGAILCILFAVSFFSSTISQNTVLYGATMLLLILLWAGSRTVLVKYPSMTSLFCGIFLLLFYGFGIILGTFNQPHVPATTFCVLLFIGPLLFLERPSRMAVLLFAVTVLFCMASFHTKAAEFANLDEVNSLSFLFVSILVNATITRVKMRELVHHRYIEHARDTDDLTKLMTKAAIERAVKEYMEATREPAALLVIDIDDFKSINDNYGHAYGDAVLRIMGKCIRQVFRGTDLMGRFGGDEFVVFLPEMKDASVVGQRVEALVDLMKKQIEVPQRAHHIHGSIGIALYPVDADNYEELFKKADEALYKSKRNGKDRYTFYVDVDEHLEGLK